MLPVPSPTSLIKSRLFHFGLLRVLGGGTTTSYQENVGSPTCRIKTESDRKKMLNPSLPLLILPCKCLTPPTHADPPPCKCPFDFFLRDGFLNWLETGNDIGRGICKRELESLGANHTCSPQQMAFPCSAYLCEFGNMDLQIE